MAADPVRRPSGTTLSDVVADVARLSPDHPAILFGDAVVSYQELQYRADRVARALLASGVERGDRVGALLGNTPEWIEMALGAATIGATFVPLNTWYKSSELGWSLRHCGLKILVSAARFIKTDYVALLGQVIPDLASGAGRSGELFPALRDVVFVGEEVPARLNRWDEFLLRAERVSMADLDAARASVTAKDIAYILYTSGSTADPKGVTLNHGGVVANGFDMGARRGIVGEDRVWLGTPLFYGLGATNALPATLTRGATIVLQGFFEAGAAIDVVERTGSTVYYGTGNMTQAILDHADYAQRRIGTLQKGNAGTTATYKRLTLLEMGISGAVPAYGLTETYGNATVGRVDDPIDAKIETNGAPLDGMEMRIVDPQSGAELPQGAVGLVLIRGHTTPGYFANPEETARALRPDGFFDTGDLGSFDQDGRFHFSSRLKEVLKSGGINISPLEVEQLIATHSGVRDAYVVGVPDAVLGERIVAFVDASSSLEADEIRAFVKERAASFKVPHHVLFRGEEQLPRLASGKVAKYKLAEEARRELDL